MYRIQIENNLLDKKSEQLIRQISKKIDRELLLFSDFHFSFEASRKSKKSCIIKIKINSSQGHLLSEEFTSRDWESALRQSVDLLIRSVRADFLHQKNQSQFVHETL